MVFSRCIRVELADQRVLQTHLCCRNSYKSPVWSLSAFATGLSQSDCVSFMMHANCYVHLQSSACCILSPASGFWLCFTASTHFPATSSSGVVTRMVFCFLSAWPSGCFAGLLCSVRLSHVTALHQCAWDGICLQCMVPKARAWVVL